jgi:hypothetical protein
MLLTVLIPTRNRQDLALKQAKAVSSALANYLSPGDFEIILSDNSTQQGIYEFLKNKLQSDPSIKLLNQHGAFDSAEEHIFATIKEVSGKYIWTLSDDDVILSFGIQKLCNLLLTGSSDAIFFNAFWTDKFGVTTEKRLLPGAESLQINYETFVKLSGFWFAAPMISGMVFKREIFNQQIAEEIVEICGPIYSHVAFFLAVLKNRTFTYEPHPLVRYAENNYDSNKSWLNYSQKKGQPLHHPWVVQFPKQIQYLIENNWIDKSFLRNAMDRDINEVFLLSDHLIHNILVSLLNREDLNYQVAIGLLKETYPEQLIKFEELESITKSSRWAIKKDVRHFQVTYPSSRNNHDFSILVITADDRKKLLDLPLGPIWLPKDLNVISALNSLVLYPSGSKFYEDKVQNYSSQRQISQSEITSLTDFEIRVLKQIVKTLAVLYMYFPKYLRKYILRKVS